MSPVDWFWKVFEATGSPEAYLVYKNYVSAPEHDDQDKRELSFKGSGAED